MKQRMGSELPIWKIVNGKTIHKIDNGFLVWGLTEGNMRYIKDTEGLVAIIKEDDALQIHNHLERGKGGREKNEKNRKRERA